MYDVILTAVQNLFSCTYINLSLNSNLTQTLQTTVIYSKMRHKYTRQSTPTTVQQSDFYLRWLCTFLLLDFERSDECIFYHGK